MYTSQYSYSQHSMKCILYVYIRASQAICSQESFCLFFLNICFIEVQLIYNVVLISTVQQSESVVLIYMCRYMCMCIYKIYIYILICVCIGEGNGTPLQYSYLENPMDGGAW